MEDSQSFRRPLIEAVRAIKAQQPQARLHLLYTPELIDPLSLINDTRRETALIRPPSAAKHVVAPPAQNLPRLITLDCLRVAKFMLETDAGLDDPLFEESLTQAYAEIALHQRPDPELDNNEREFSDFAIGGWWVSCESALTIALRITDFSLLRSADRGREWVRWTNPAYLSALWPLLSAEQRQALLGEAIWFAFDASGRLQRYAADDRAMLPSDPSEATAGYLLRNLDAQQSRVVKNVPLVRDLLPRWQTICTERGERLPIDAERQLHAHVQAAQGYGLDADSLTIYVMTAVQLKPAAMQDAEWTQLVRSAGHDGLPLRDQLGQLPDEFWDRWSITEPSEDD